ncbi:DUF5915 domain-containing protein, partial [Mesobacillus zeae]
VLKLNFKTAGAAFGRHVNAVKHYVGTLSDNEKKELLNNGRLEINVERQIITLLQEHLNVSYTVTPGFEMAGDQQIKVILDLRVTPQLLEEGYVRELIRAIQDTRKKLNLPVEEYISIHISAADTVRETIQRFEGLIKENVLVRNINFETRTDLQQHVEVKFDNELAKVSLIY